MMNRIKTYLEVFGNKIEPSVNFLPPVYYPSENGWISAIQETFTPENEGDPTYEVLGILYEQEFQRRFGKLRISSDFRNIVNHWREYGVSDYEQATTFEHESVLAFVSHRLPEWEKLYQTMLIQYDPTYNYEQFNDTTTTTGFAGAETLTKGGTETDEKQGEESLEKQGSEIMTPAGKETVTTKDKYNGFNSSSSVPVSDSETETSFTTRTDTKSFNQRKDVTTFNQRKNVKTFTNRTDTKSFTDREDTETIDGHIYGAINAERSKMIENELELRKKDLATYIYKEIADKFLLSVY